jgi:hypothetical protein
MNAEYLLSKINELKTKQEQIKYAIDNIDELNAINFIFKRSDNDTSNFVYSKNDSFLYELQRIYLNHLQNEYDETDSALKLLHDIALNINKKD